MAEQRPMTTTSGGSGVGAATARAFEAASEAPEATSSAVVAHTSDSARKHEQIAQLAHSYWQTRGCPEGSPEED